MRLKREVQNLTTLDTKKLEGDAFVAELRTRFGDRIVEDNIWADWQAINQYHLERFKLKDLIVDSQDFAFVSV